GKVGRTSGAGMSKHVGRVRGYRTGWPGAKSVHVTAGEGRSVAAEGRRRWRRAAGSTRTSLARRRSGPLAPRRTVRGRTGRRRRPSGVDGVLGVLFHVGRPVGDLDGSTEAQEPAAEGNRRKGE